MDNNLKNKLLRIKALADQWIGWEKVNAINLLNKMCEEYWINVDDLNNIAHLNFVWNKTDSQIALHVITSILWYKKFEEMWWDAYSYKFSRKHYINLKWSESQILQIRIAIDHYINLYKKQKKSILKSIFPSFIHKYQLYNIDPSDWSVNKHKNNLDFNLIRQMMWIMEDDIWPLLPLE